jgi:ubiquinone/menaquinone biosynthesis C-methylase UbiE
MDAKREQVNPFANPAHAEGYDTWYETPLGAAMDRAQKRLVWRLARPQAGETALDVGTGTGNYACELARMGLQVVGRDPSEAMLAVARAKQCGVTWEQGSAEQLPHEDGRFDLVLSVTALEFMADPLSALAEMWRVTAPGGRLVIGTLNRASAWGEIYAELAQDPESAFYGAQLLTPVQFLALLARLGREGRPPSRAASTQAAAKRRQIEWGSAGFLPPTGRGLAWAGLVEAWGGRLRRARGALLVGKVDKP